MSIFRNGMRLAMGAGLLANVTQVANVGERLSLADGLLAVVICIFINARTGAQAYYRQRTLQQCSTL